MAMELGRPQTLSGLGEALSLKLPLRLSPGETLNVDCIQVTIETANQVLPAQQVQKTVDYPADSQSGWIWIKTTVAIEEPVLKLALGCPQQQITAFIDPVPAAAAKPSAALAAPSSTATLAKAPARVKPVVLGPDRLRFDLDSGRARRASKTAGDWQQDAQNPARAGFALLMSLEPGRPPAAAPAEALASASGLSQRVQQAEREFTSLQQEQASLNRELDSLAQRLAQRQTSSWAAGSPLLWLGATAMLALAGLAYRWLKPRWRSLSDR